MSRERGSRGGRRSSGGRGRVPKEDRPSEIFPRIKVDPNSDSAYVELRPIVSVEKSIVVDNLRTIDLDSQDNVLGVEFMEFSGGANLDDLPISEEDLIAVRVAVDEYKGSTRKRRRGR